ncbi:MAG: N-6 DNA methylase [Acidobacteria bacterium]|nr:N-6 DNA methylase [Acidobacteriota bacterium]
MTMPGVGGWLLPARFLAERIAPIATSDQRVQAQWARWWRDVSHACGPATGVRTLFDTAAMPLFGRLGFRARNPRFAPGGATATLLTPGGQTIALLVRPWADRPPALFREATSAARDAGANWCCVFAPPTLSIVPASGNVTRRSLDFTFPAAADPGSLGIFLMLAGSAAFDTGALDHWLDAARTDAARVRVDLQQGVIDALAELTQVLTRATRATPTGEALTLVYRILFLMFAESRDLVPRHHPVYRDTYTLSSLCSEALRATPARGLWDGLAAISRLSRQGGQVDTLQVFPFNGHLFSSQAAPTLESTRGGGRRTRDSDARDLAVSRALVSLGTRREPAGRVAISYADLGVEELGAVYERVLDVEATPGAQVHRPSARRHSAKRKDTGTFYTPQVLADFVVQRTLAPLVEEASADRLLELRVVDPAMGSGAFLVAALRYMGAAYERALVRDGRCAQSDVTDSDRAAFRRRIAQQCLFGVDANPVAVQVARLSLWLATLAHARPLSFLDHRLRTGNSLVGASPADLLRSPGASTHELPLFDSGSSRLEVMLRRVVPTLADLGTQADDSVQDVRRKEATWAELRDDSHPLSRWRLAVSLWCAQWFWPAGTRRPSPAEIRAGGDALVRGSGDLASTEVGRLASIATATSAAQQFFHWPLEFPEVFYDSGGVLRPTGGFDAVIGNPPWEMVRRDSSSGRRSAVRDPLVTFVRESGLFPLCRRGHLNLYQPFVERSLSLVRPGGRVGLVVPWGFAVDDGASGLRSALVDAAALDTIVGFDNARGLFPIHRGLRFAVVVAAPGGPRRDIHARFGVTTAETIQEMTAAAEDPLPIQLSAEAVAEVGGPSRRIPDLRDDDGMVWLLEVMRAHPAIGGADGWQARFSRELNATDDRDAFSTKAGSGGLPVADGKHIAPFVVNVEQCERFIRAQTAERRLSERRFTRPRLAYRDVSGVGNQFTLIAAVMPAGVVTTHTLFCLRNELPIEQQHFLCGVFNSAVLNRVVRLLMGGHVTTSLVEQLPVPRWEATRVQLRIASIAARLADPGLGNSVRTRLTDRLNQDVERLYVKRD